MPSSYQLIFNGTPAEDTLYPQLTSVEVEENADLPGAVQFQLPISSSNGDLTNVNDPRFKPFAPLAVIATPDGGNAQCIFDGVVLSHKMHLERGITSSTLQIWGQDSSWLMNLKEKVREWVDVTDADVASSIFGEYGITPSADNSTDDSPSHTEDGHTLMQRGTDIQFLRNLARRNGKLCRITCDSTPGVRTGFFAKPDLSGAPDLQFSLNDQQNWAFESLDIDWDATRPTSVVARQALFTESDPDGVSADTSDSGLAALDDQTLAQFTGSPMTVILTAPVDDAGELSLRAQSVLREAGWFVRCEGEADIARINAVLRVGMIVQINDIGAVHSGNYYVWSVRHTITADSHRMKFVLMRNAVGTPPTGSGAGPLGSLL